MVWVGLGGRIMRLGRNVGVYGCGGHGEQAANSLVLTNLYFSILPFETCCDKMSQAMCEEADDWSYESSRMRLELLAMHAPLS